LFENINPNKLALVSRALESWNVIIKDY